MKVQEYFSDPSKWHQGCAFRDKNGRALPGPSYNNEFIRENVASCCILGAILYCYKDRNEADFIIEKIGKRFNYDIAAWNDSPNTKFEDIVELSKQENI